MYDLRSKKVFVKYIVTTIYFLILFRYYAVFLFFNATIKNKTHKLQI